MKQTFSNNMKKYKFNICIAGEKEGNYSSMSVINGNLSEKFRMIRESPAEEYFLDKWHLKVSLCKQNLLYGEMIKITAENCSDADICITHLSVLNFLDAETKDFSKIKINYFKCNWESEFQFHSTDFFSEDIKKVAIHPITKSFKISSKGSYTTSEYFPMIVLEDISAQKAVLILQYPENSWQIEAGIGGNRPYIDCSDVNLRGNHNVYILKPKENRPFTRVIRIEGVNFEDCIRKLILTKREINREKPHPLVFNDYMNCLWGRLDETIMHSLADCAAQLGLEYYCIDAGWFENYDSPWGQTLGDWKPSEKVFAQNGFLNFLKYIKSKGLQPGIWLEMEVCSQDSELFKKPDDWFLLYNGKRIGGEDRYFLNFKNSEVTDYLYGIVTKLYNSGVRYIKNDYNCSIAYFPQEYCDHTRAVKDFYKKLKYDFPDLVLENCASGAMRCDPEFLEIFDLQSTSDQEIYTNYPSIIQGALCNILPEQAGIWVYPNPHPFQEYFTGLPMNPDAYDIENVVFNMVNGFCGLPYISGRIDLLPERSFAILKTGISLYKIYRNFLLKSIPEYPVSFSRIGENKNTAILFSNGEEGILIVWRLDENEELLDFGKKFSDLKLIYPDYATEDKILQGETTKIYIKMKNSARIFSCRIEI